MKKQDIQNVAIAEILHPTLALTRQFLAVNTVVFKENIPSIEDIILKEEDNSAEVYFPIAGEDYYFVVYLDLHPQIAVRWICMSPGNYVSFVATSQDREIDELLTLTSIEPTRILTKGINSSHNGFEIQPSLKNTGDVEDKVDTLITVLRPHKTSLEALSTIADMGIQIAYWGYKEQMWGIHFKEETLQELGRLNLSIDIDIYASGKDLLF